MNTRQLIETYHDAWTSKALLQDLTPMTPDDSASAGYL